MAFRHPRPARRVGRRRSLVAGLSLRGVPPLHDDGRGFGVTDPALEYGVQADHGCDDRDGHLGRLVGGLGRRLGQARSAVGDRLWLLSRHAGLLVLRPGERDQPGEVGRWVDPTYVRLAVWTTGAIGLYMVVVASLMIRRSPPPVEQQYDRHVLVDGGYMPFNRPSQPNVIERPPWESRSDDEADDPSEGDLQSVSTSLKSFLSDATSGSRSFLIVSHTTRVSTPKYSCTTTLRMSAMSRQGTSG